MAIATLDQYIAALKQRICWFKSGTRTTIAALPFCLFELAGQPGAGALAIGNTANGLVPTDADAGYPTITNFGGSALGYLSKVEFANTVACRLAIFDRLFAAGAYAFDTDTGLAFQSSFGSRVPSGDYKNLELWIEAVTAFTGSPSFQINYLDQDGNAGDTGVIASGSALTLGQCFQMPLAAGDCGIRLIDRVRGTVASGGTFNLMVMRPLWSGRIPVACGGDVHDLLRTGMVRVFENSALYVLMYADSTASGAPEMSLEIASA
jgi:hypothetical protein